MSDSDARTFLHYEDTPNREPVPGAPSRRSSAALSGHVAVRFPAETIRLIDELARADDLTASTWVRRVVDLAIEEGQHEGSVNQTD